MAENSKQRLDSWKEIADYLGRDVRTVSRWEKEKNLPVHRVPGGKRQAVFAFRNEIDAWLRMQPSEPADSEFAGHATATTPVPTTSANGVSKWRRLVWPAAVLLVVPALGLVWRTTSHPTPPTNSSSNAPLQMVPVTSYPGVEWTPVISPDGKYVAFTWNGGKEPLYDLYIQLIGAGEPLRITHGGAAGLPTWSPDGRFIAFTRTLPGKGKEILAVPALGGMERKLGDVTDSLSGGSYLSWSPDGKWIAYRDRNSPREVFSIYFLSPETGEKKKFTSPPGELLGDVFPAFSPDGQNLAFTRGNFIFLAPLAGGVPRQLTTDRKSILHLAWTADSREIIYSGLRSGDYELWRIPVAGGSPVPLRLGEGQYYFPSVSRQGNRLAFARSDDDPNIWRLPLSGPGKAAGPPKALIASTRDDDAPKFSPDGRKIIFGSNRSGNGELWICNSDGSNPQQLTSFENVIVDTFGWSPDSQSVLVTMRREGFEAYLVKLDGSPPKRLESAPPMEAFPKFSQDGRWTYFASTNGGKLQVWRMPAAGGQASQITRDGGFDSATSADGKFLYFTRDLILPGLWRMELPSGAATLLVPEVPAGGWVLAQGGIYFVRPSTVSLRGSIDYLDLATGRRQTVYVPPTDFKTTAIDISPDGRWLLFVQYDRRNHDVFLVENFH
jgi:Tol biopolymer transport system component